MLSGGGRRRMAAGKEAMSGSRTLVSLVLLGVVLVTCGGRCGGGSEVAINELARDLSTSRYQADTLTADLRRANGGGKNMNEGLAQQLRKSSAVSELLSNTGEVAGNACDAWDLGLEDVVTDTPTSIPVLAQSNQLLDQMQSEADDNASAKDAISTICKLQNLGNGA